MLNVKFIFESALAKLQKVAKTHAQEISRAYAQEISYCRNHTMKIFYHRNLISIKIKYAVDMLLRNNDNQKNVR